MERIKIFAKTIEQEAIDQIDAMGNSVAYRDCTIRIMPDCHAGKGCTVGTVIQIKDRVIPNTVGVDIGCIDRDTEVLTPNGWIKVSDYNGQDILQYNANTDTGAFIKPLAYIKKECDYFWHFKNSKGLDQMVSDEHNMLVYKGHHKLSYLNMKPLELASKSLEKGFYRFKTCFNTSSLGIDISNEFIRIDIMVQADGRIREYENYNHIELHFTKQRKIERAIQLLNAANIKYNLYQAKDGSTFISFRCPKYIFKDLTKYYNANYSQLKIVCEECLFWDGHKGERNYYSSTNKHNIDVIQYAFIATNTRASIYRHNEKNQKNWKTTYNVIPTKNAYVGYNIKPTKVASVDGYKYCFTTNTGFFLCRRNDYTFLTGNCGMLVYELGDIEIDLQKLDKVINQCIPSGFDSHKQIASYFNFDYFRCINNIDTDKALLQIGTLGGGNHFIEVNVDSNNNKYLVIHSGSRNLGKRVCEYYQNKAYELCNVIDNKVARESIIKFLKARGEENKIQEALSKLVVNNIPKDLCYLWGVDLNNYLNDMYIAQKYASENRQTIADIICNQMGWCKESMFETIHNYIDVGKRILRKGAVSANLGEKLIIPINMRDGSLICAGRGNIDWLCSAPHGAGRLMSRKKAKETLSMKQYDKEMRNVYSTSICESTLDEAPMAYKPLEEIVECIKPTVAVLEQIKPIYNFKAK